MAENDVTWLEVSGGDPEVTSLDRKSPGSGYRRPVSQVLDAFELLQAVTRKFGSHVT